MACEVHNGKEQVADLFLPMGMAGRAGNLVQFLMDLGDRALGIGPVEAGAGSPLLQFFGAQQRRKRLRDAGHGARVGDLVGAFGRLDAFPLGMAILAPGAFAKDMGMTPDHLGRNAVDHVLQAEMAGLFGDAAVEDDLEQQIAQFIA